MSIRDTHCTSSRHFDFQVWDSEDIQSEKNRAGCQGYINECLILASTPCLQFTGLSWSEQSELGFSNSWMIVISVFFFLNKFLYHLSPTHTLQDFKNLTEATRKAKQGWGGLGQMLWTNGEKLHLILIILFCIYHPCVLTLKLSFKKNLLDWWKSNCSFWPWILNHYN